MSWLLIIIGIIFLLLAALLETYCEFGRQAATDYSPEIFRRRSRWLFEAGWVLLLLIGGILLLLEDWKWAVGGIALFWLVMPILLMPMMRKRLLPPWEMVKDKLERQGYTEKNYWSGDWWKKKKDKDKKKS